MSDIEEPVADMIIIFLQPDRDAIKPSARFREDLDADSPKVADLIIQPTTRLISRSPTRRRKRSSPWAI